MTRFAGVLSAAAFLLAAFAGPIAAAEEPQRTEPALGEDGLYIQPWFLHSFLDLKEDLADSAKAGKRLVVMWEQRGCPYCKETHTINLADPYINKYLRENFNVIQLNLWGDREVTDFDGQVLAEKQLARKWGIVYTPTIMFFPEEVKDVVGKSGRDAEVARMPGYFRPFHFGAMFHYVREKRYADIHFQKYLDEYAERLRKQGKDVKVW
jgi:thioredoxin-related protein